MPAKSFTKRSFAGGINQLADTTKIQDNQYPLLINGRSNFDKVKPIKKSTLITDDRWTRIQGIYTADYLVLVFADGRAYWRDLRNTTSDTFNQVPNFAMDSTVEVIYAQLVPSASLTSKRSAVDNDDSSAGATYSTSGQSYPQAIVVQDGINQPWLIFSDNTARQAQNYAQWTTDNREYVPIGKQMLYSGGILYVVSPDGTRILRSVTGRPCDFMVVVDKNGNKLPDASEGDANSVSYQVDYNPIKAIAPVNLQDGSFFVSTGYTSYLVTPKRDVTIFDEPYFSSSWLFPTGPQNNFSLVDVIGDAVFITSRGIRSFNAVMNTRFEGKNLPFSRLVSRLFEGVVQGYTAALIYDEEYALFSCKTVYGNSIVAYNIVNQVFESVDLISNLTGVVKQFSMTRVDGTNRLFAITDANEVVELYADPTLYELARLYVGDWISQENLSAEQKPVKAKVILDNIVEDGTVYATLFVDGQSHTRIPSSVEATATPEVILTPPNGIKSTADISVQYLDSPTGWKIGLWIEWGFNAELVGVVLESSENDSLNALPTQADELDYFRAGDATITYFAPLTGIPNTIITVTGVGMLSVSKVWVRDIEVLDFSRISDTQIMVKAPASSGKIKLQTLSGNFIYSVEDFICIQ